MLISFNTVPDFTWMLECLLGFFFFLFYFLLLEIVTEKHLSSVGFAPYTHVGLAHTDVSCQELYPGLPQRGSGTWADTCCLPGCIGRSLCVKPRKPSLTLTVQFNLLHHSAWPMSFLFEQLRSSPKSKGRILVVTCRDLHKDVAVCTILLWVLPRCDKDRPHFAKTTQQSAKMLSIKMFPICDYPLYFKIGLTNFLFLMIQVKST